MEFFLDRYFTIGKMHSRKGQPCEDYAWTQQEKEKNWIIVSDGCSGGEDTDIGSRIIIMSLNKILKEKDENYLKWAKKIPLEQKTILKEWQKATGLQEKNMLATYVLGFLTPQGGFFQIQGDGAIILQYKKLIKIYRFDWNNFPCYPIYSQKHYQILKNNIGPYPFKVQKFFLCRKNKKIVKLEKNYPLEKGAQGFTFFLDKKKIQDLEMALVFTDGLSQIEKLPFLKAVREFLDFKSMAGCFLKRRAIKIFKEINKNGCGPLDDFAVAAIYLKE